MVLSGKREEKKKAVEIKMLVLPSASRFIFLILKRHKKKLEMW